MSVNDLTLYSRISSNRVFSRLAGFVGDNSGNRCDDQNDKCCSPENVGGPEIRRDQQAERKRTSENRCVIDEQVNVDSREHFRRLVVRENLANSKPPCFDELSSGVFSFLLDEHESDHGTKS